MLNLRHSFRTASFQLLLCMGVITVAACSNTPTKEELKSVQVYTDDHLSNEGQFRCYPIDNDAFDHPVDFLPLPVAPSENIWPRVQHELSLKYRNDPRVQAQLNWYVRHPEYFKRVQIRASRFLYHILEELHQQNAPVDLALLPIVESAYEPFAYSHGQAAGLWQFIPMTADRFKLERNWWIDERRDAVESTRAAIKYLSYLSRYFDGDWELAIAAYNAGEGRVRKAVKRNQKAGKPIDFWHLDLPVETSAYVPKMIALSELFRDPNKYGLELIDISNEPYFADVTLDTQIDLAQAAELADIDMDELYYLNAGLNRWATPPSGSYKLKLPKEKVASFESALKQLPIKERITWHRYIVQSGDNLSSIAKTFNSQIDAIRAANKLRGNEIPAGKALLIPTAKAKASQYRLSQDQRLAKRQAISPENGSYKHVYYVKPGDTFWSIAKQYKVDIQALARWNSKSPKDSLKINEKLVIWTKSPDRATNSQARVRRVNYKVRAGDSLAKVASKFNVGINQIAKWNKLDKRDYIQPGQKLKLYVNVMDTYH